MKTRLNQQRWHRPGVIISSLIGIALTASGQQWNTLTPLPDTYWGQSLVYASNYLYQAGGESGSNGVTDGVNVFSAQVHSDGTIGSWNATTPLPIAVDDHAGVVANGFIYVLGGINYPTNYYETYNYVISSNVYYAKINSDASLGSWQTANPLPDALVYLTASVWNNRIYVVGGFDGNDFTNAVYSATIQSDGSLSAWTAQTPLPVANYAQAEAANGFLYVLGGVIDGGTEVVNTVYYSKINADGSLEGWNQTTPLPQPESNFGAIVVNGLVFSIAGYNGSEPTSSFYFAAVNGDGSLGFWSSGTSLPVPLFEQAVASSSSYIFVTGGTDFEANQSAVYSMALPAPPVVPTLVAGSFTNGNFQVQLASSTNTGFGLLASPDLINWTNLGWGFTGTNGTLLLVDTNATHFPRRFYRAYWPLP
ncbi:MAG: Kelch repeat-containing protein [Limisphaerales bacterium]